jgi:hypothetical protein
MATAVIPDTDRLNPQFAQMAKHYGVDVAVCPPHRPQRKGVVEAAIKFIGGRWWRTAKAGSMLEAQQSLDTFTVNISDRRGRRGSTVGELGNLEPLRPLPALAFPAEIMVERVASRGALVLFETNKYSVPPGYARQPLTVRALVGEPYLRIVTATGIKVSLRTDAPRTAPSRPSAAPNTPSRSSGPCWTRSRPKPHADRRSTGRPGTGRSPSSPSSTANHRARPRRSCH